MRGLSLRSDWGHCVVFLGKTVTICLSPPRSINNWVVANCQRNLTNNAGYNNIRETQWPSG